LPGPILEKTRERYGFVVVGYVVTPEHIHLLLTEPEISSPSTVMEVVKQRTLALRCPSAKRGLVDAPEQWRWSSYGFYLLNEAGPVRVNEGWGKISFRDRVA
jgi:putative transposase